MGGYSPWRGDGVKGGGKRSPEAAPLPKRGHLCIGRVLGLVGLADTLKNDCSMVLRDRL